MTTPHEYMDEYGEWNLHSYHNSDLYTDPDYMASEADDQLPLLSTIGRGPRGNGVKVKATQKDGSYILTFFDDVTNEVLAQTPDLDPGYIEVSWPSHNKQEGEVGQMTITHRKNSGARSYTVPLPPGAHGSRLYLTNDVSTHRDDATYTAPTQELMHYGRAQWADKPRPRPGDIIVFKLYEDNQFKLAFGTIESVTDYQTIFTSRTTIGIPGFSVSEKGTWMLDGVDTGMQAVGPQGPQGIPGEQGPQGIQGPKGNKGDKGDTGLDGIDGKDAKIALGNVTTLAPELNAQITTSFDPLTNTTTLNFALPQGSPGKAINIQGGIWRYEDLPNYDTTPINNAFVVYDDDRQFDLYIRGEIPSHAELGGPWTVVEDWQGRPGNGVHYLQNPYMIDARLEYTTSVPAAEADLAFLPSDYLTDGDLIIDEDLNIGILGSAEDNSGYYTITTIGNLESPSTWDKISGKPFDSVDTDGLLDINDGILSIKDPSWTDVTDKPDTYPTTWDEVSEKPFSSIDTESGTLYIDDDDELHFVAATSWDDLADKPFDTIGDGLSIVDGTLIADVQESITNWADLEDKPFENIGTGLNVTPEGSLYALAQEIETMDAETAEAIAEKAFEDFSAAGVVGTKMIEDGAVTLEKLSPDVQEAWNSRTRVRTIGNTKSTSYVSIGHADDHELYILALVYSGPYKITATTLIPREFLDLATSSNPHEACNVDENNKKLRAQCYLSGEEIYARSSDSAWAQAYVFGID